MYYHSEFAETIISEERISQYTTIAQNYNAPGRLQTSYSLFSQPSLTQNDLENFKPQEKPYFNRNYRHHLWNLLIKRYPGLNSVNCLYILIHAEFRKTCLHFYKRGGHYQSIIQFMAQFDNMDCQLAAQRSYNHA